MSKPKLTTKDKVAMAFKEKPEIVDIEIETEIAIGQFPEGHEHEGKWAIQMVAAPFASRALANKFCDQNVTPLVGRLSGAKVQ